MKSAWLLRVVRHFITIAVLVAVPTAISNADETPPAKTIRVLFVGNSQVYYNELHKIVETLAESAPKDRPRIRTDARPSDRSVAGGASLESHWNRGTGKDTARAKIAEEKWDFVILQDLSFYTTPESFTKHARLFHDLIHQQGAKTVLLSTASFPNLVPKSFLEIHDRHATLAKELKVPVAAAGKAWLAYWGDNPTQEQILDLYDQDKGHPGKKGSYLYACTLYAVITGLSPVGLTHRIPNQPEDTITAAEAKRFQEAAWRVHQEMSADETLKRSVSFTNEVMSVVSKRGCNSGACHGHSSGKGSFKLSLRGSNPAADRKALVDYADLAEPDQSYMLLKPTTQEPHRGGKRFEVGSDSYKILRQWVAEGGQADMDRAVPLRRIEIIPDIQLMPRPGMVQQLVVQAHFADGTIRDVTDQAIYELSGEGVIEVDSDGLVTGKREGEAAVFVRFLGKMGLSRFVVIQHKPDFAWPETPQNNFVDQHVHAKLRSIQVLPSEVCTDAEFLRRVSFDVTGLPPTATEVREFLADARADKRPRKIDELLDRDEFGDVWAAHWLELSGTDQSGDSAGFKGMWTLIFWLRDVINRNLPYDQFVKSLVAAQGSSLQNPAVTFGVTRVPKVEVIPQLFLGVRLECAQCHDHPFDVWKQSDYNALREFFSDTTSKEGPGDFYGREIRVFIPPERFLPWEKDKKVTLRLLDGSTAEVLANQDRRAVVADCIRSHEATLPQVLHLLNGETIDQRLRAADGTLHQLLKVNLSDERLVEDLYFTILSRPPSDREQQVGQGYLRDSSTRQEDAEDLMWALLTSQEFLFNH